MDNPDQNNQDKLSLLAVILMIFTAVYGFNNVHNAFYKMGYASIIWYILGALLFFIPNSFMLTELAAAYHKEKGGLYTWMADNVSVKFAFMGLIMWYASYVIWMMNTSFRVLIPLTIMVYGSDTTQSMQLGSLNYGQILGILAIVWICLVTFISSFGIKSITNITNLGGIMVMALNFLLIVGGFVAWAANGFHIQYGFTGNWLFESPNPASLQNTPIYLASFLVFAMFAYGGVEAVTNLVDKIKNPTKNLPKAILISAIVISVGYALMIFIIGLFTNWDRVLNSETVSLGNITYEIIQELGYQLGIGLGASPETAVAIATVFTRFTALGIFFTFAGAFFTLCYSPLKTLIEGTPREIWPDFIHRERNGLPVNAMWVQALVVVFFILLSTLGGNGAKYFFDYILTPMTNVAMTVPFLFIVYTFYKFRKNKRITMPIVIFKTDRSVFIATICVFVSVTYANVMSIFEPVLTSGFDDKEAVLSTVFQIFGPVFFAAIGFLLYKRTKVGHQLN